MIYITRQSKGKFQLRPENGEKRKPYYVTNGRTLH